MKNQRLTSIAAFTFTLLMVAISTLAAEPTASEYGVIINLSGKQRMLTQKMSKETLLIALNVNTQGNLENLKKSSQLFDKTLKGLKNGDTSLGLVPVNKRRIVKQLGRIEKLWLPFFVEIKKVITSGSATKEQIAFIAENNLPLLKNMNKCVLLYEKDASKTALKNDKGLAASINLAGKQRMLTQKMSKEFFLIAYKHNAADNKLNLIETSDLFERTLKGLVEGDDILGLPGTKNQKIIEQINTVTSLWKEMSPFIKVGSSTNTSKIPADAISNVAAKNVPLLKAMNDAVKLFEKESAK